MLDWVIVAFIGAFIATVVLAGVLVIFGSASMTTFWIVSALCVVGVLVAICGLVAEEMRDE